MVELLRDLVAANAISRQAVDALVEQSMHDVGCEVEVLTYDPGDLPLIDEFAHDEQRDGEPQTCLIGRLRGSGGGRSLILFAHPDTEPVERAVVWSNDAFQLQSKNGKLTGWGVADSLAGVAMLTGSVSELGACGKRPAGDLVLISSPSKRHRRGIAAALHHGVSADAAVYLHPAESGRGLDDIKAFAPGQLEFMIEILGRPPDTHEPAHTAFSHLAVNPFLKAWPVVQALEALDRTRGGLIRNSLLDAAIGRSSNIMITRCDFGVPDRPLQVDGSCRLRVAMTLIPGELLDEVQAEVEGAIADEAQKDEWLAAHPPEIIWLAGVAAAETSQDSDLYKTAANTLSRYGATPSVNPLHTSSDIRNPLVQKGIPTIGFGPLCGNLASNGCNGEWVDSGDLGRATRATADLIVEWCGSAPESHSCSG